MCGCACVCVFTATGQGVDDSKARKRSALESALGVVEKFESHLIRQVPEAPSPEDDARVIGAPAEPAEGDPSPGRVDRKSAPAIHPLEFYSSKHGRPAGHQQSLSSSAMYDVSLMGRGIARTDYRKLFTKEKALHPHHPIVRIFDVATVLSITWYCFSVPYFVAFDLNDLGKTSSTWYTGVEIFLWVLVMIDAALSMVTGFVATQGRMRGELELRTATIFRQYTRMYLLRDLLSLAPIDLIFGPRAESVQGRLFLLWKLSRVNMLPRALARLESLTAKIHPTVIRLVSLLWMLSLLFHILGCSYWVVARIERENGAQARSSSLAHHRSVDATQCRSGSWQAFGIPIHLKKLKHLATSTETGNGAHGSPKKKSGLVKLTMHSSCMLSSGPSPSLR